MTNPREQREARTAATACTEPEMIEDLDVTRDDADAVGGGDGGTGKVTFTPFQITRQTDKASPGF